MNDTSARCAGPGSSCRLLQLETPGARPVWAVLDAAGQRRFTGELTLASWPVVRAWFNDGEVYYAEREGDPSISDRLLEYGVVTPEQLAAGTVHLGTVAHLGRLFDRVPGLERDPVELVLEVVTGEVLGQIADHTVEHISIASYRHHPSGVSKWRRRAPSAGADDAVLTGEVPVIHTGQILQVAPIGAALLTPLETPRPDVIIDHPGPEPTAQDHQMVAEYEQLMSAVGNQVMEVGEPTEQLVVPDSLLIFEAPTDLPIHIEPVQDFRPAPMPEPVIETAPVAEFQPEPVAEMEIEPVAIVELEPEVEPVAIVEAEPEVDMEADPVDDRTAPFTFSFDLNKVLAQVAFENNGLPMSSTGDDSDDDVDDDVRRAVREALAEITAATRPTASEGLSSTAFAIALDTAPDSPADIEPAGAAAPYLPNRGLPNRALHSPSDDAGEASETEADGTDGLPNAGDTPGPGLRRLIGGSRKP